MIKKAGDGMWTATCVPATGSVTIGAVATFPATRDEVGHWSTANPLSGETAVLTEESPYEVLGNAYLLSSDRAGTWTATYQTVTAMVDLSALPGRR